MEICMNKKRVTAVILSAMMCMQIFTGCGAKNNAAAVEGGAGLLLKIYFHQFELAQLLQ